MFTTTPTAHDLWSDHGDRIRDVFAETGMELVRRRLEHLSEDDLSRQLWFIACLVCQCAQKPRIV